MANKSFSTIHCNISTTFISKGSGFENDRHPPECDQNQNVITGKCGVLLMKLKEIVSLCRPTKDRDDDQSDTCKRCVFAGYK